MASPKLAAWMAVATTLEQIELAETAGTSRAHLYQLTYDGTPAARTASADLAGRIEAAAKPIVKRAKGRLPELTRADLAPACAACPYFRKCAGKKTP